jgi:molecular chaperone HtpG
MSNKKTRKFKTEVQQLLELVIHSLYSKKDIFLRELISNASDAIDRAKFEALTQPDLVEAGEAWQIRLVVDRDARTLTIRDNGIGMSADEVETNIGTIANSGTRTFLEQIRGSAAGADAEFIGQFGVGFYAAFMVAEPVTLNTRRAGTDSTPVLWTSDGTGSYTLEDGDKAERGTAITLHLREGMDTYLDEWEIRRIVKAYSDYIAYPILLEVLPSKDDKDDKPKPSAEEADKPLNSMKAIWRKDRKEITPEAYAEFYTHISHDHQKPLDTIHFAAEGATEFRALLYIPSQAPFDLFIRERQRGLHLYVKNVFINDDCKDLLPDYLRFTKGVVDSSDLPLNVSREMLQDDAVPRQIRRSLVAKILATLKDLREKRPDDYQTFFGLFGKVMKEGLSADFENQDKLKDLLLYPSNKTEGSTLIALKDYVARMPSDQKAIYYLPAETIEMARRSPHLEVFKQKNWEVLFWTDPIDEWVASAVTEYDGKKLQAVDRGDLEIEGSVAPTPAADETTMLDRVREVLDADIQSVRFTAHLTDSACCLVTDAHAVTPTMERLMRAMNQNPPPSKRILELNPQHALVQRLKTLHAQDPKADTFSDYVELLHGQALLLEGATPKDPARFVQLVARLMAPSTPAT